MTQPIKFRGFRVDNGKPICGDLIQSTSGRIMINPIESETLYSHREAVHPSSLGMFTGLHDKNGKEIFGAIGEKGGDIINFSNSLSYTVKFENASFCIYHNKLKDGNDSPLFWGTLFRVLELEWQDRIEIIGNQWEGK